MRKHITKAQQGIGLVEMVVALAVVVSALAGAIIAHTRFVTITLHNPSRVKAQFLAEEGLEAVRYIRDLGWDANIASRTPGVHYHLAFATSSVLWQATTTPQLVDGFTRTVVFERAYRRTSDDDLVASTSPAVKAVDPATMKAIVRVTGPGSDITLTTYFTDLFEN